MARVNVAQKSAAVQTHEGGAAVRINPEKALRRSVMSCFLWEDSFYEDGVSIADRILDLASKVKPEVLASIAIEAREEMNLRHVPLLLLEVLSRTGKGEKLVADTVARVVRRADEMGELIAIHNKLGGKRMIPAQMRNGLVRALEKFDAYQLGKYNSDKAAVKLKAVIQLTHPKPKNDAQKELWKSVLDGTLASPDTWEVNLSAGKDKKETFTRLLEEGNLGYFALLRNLRNMVQAGVDEKLVKEVISARKNGAERVLPFRYVAAARAAPTYEKELDGALVASLEGMVPLSGRTVVLVDVSGSMSDKLSGKSDLRRIDAAATLASVIPGDLRVLVFNNSVTELAARKGMAGVDNITKHLGGGTELGKAVAHVNKLRDVDRLIVITDEQSHDSVSAPVAKHAYLINVGSFQNGVGYGNGWVHIDGFSEGVLRYIQAFENDR